MTVTGGGDKSLTTVTKSLLRARASTLHQLTAWLISSNIHTHTHKDTIYQHAGFLHLHILKIINALLTWCLNIQPARPFNLPAEEEVLQTGGVGSKNVGKCCPLNVRRHRRELSLQKRLIGFNEMEASFHPAIWKRCVVSLTEYRISRYSE